MINIKIKNLIKSSGVADYKGLDINRIVSGTQIYPYDTGVAYFKYKGDTKEHEDIEVITEEEYQIAVLQHKKHLESITTPEKEIEIIKEDMNNAIMELTMLISMGGMM